MKIGSIRAHTIAIAAGLALALSGATTGAQADPMKQEVDLSHTSVHWSIGHGGFSKVTGQFREIESVEFTFDRDDVSKSSVKVVINAASIESNHFFRDNWIRSAASMNVWKFGKITFESTEIKKTGDMKGTMTGNLTLHGETKPITMEVTYNKAGKHLSGKFMIDGFTARGTLKRSDFGMTAFAPWIGDEIDFVIQMEAHRPLDS